MFESYSAYPRCTLFRSKASMSGFKDIPLHVSFNLTASHSKDTGTVLMHVRCRPAAWRHCYYIAPNIFIILDRVHILPKLGPLNMLDIFNDHLMEQQIAVVSINTAGQRDPYQTT